jgi:tRNA(Ile)-lysidine synthase
MPFERPRLTPAIADVRRAVRLGLGAAAPPDSALVLVALSGGPDSLALAAATAFEAPRAGLRAGAVVVDHGLQDGSAEVADAAADAARSLGLDPVLVRRVKVADGGGPEDAARNARYRALDDALRDTGAGHVLLGHTLDDQAETVLLGLARGSGAVSLRGMSPLTPARGVAGAAYLRPLLGIRRATTVAFCADSGLRPWTDPHNSDPAYLRVRVRERVLPTLERELGPGVADALARTAEQLREDAEALDHFAEEWAEEVAGSTDDGRLTLDVGGLAGNPPALRQRILRFAAASEYGVSLSRAHTLAISALVTDWHGQGEVSVPGVRVERQGGLLVFTPQSLSPNAHKKDASRHGID